MTIKDVGHQPGLTPHQDANQQALDVLRAKFGERLTRPGDAGARERIRLAMIEAYSSAMARERDNGIRMSVIGSGITAGIADVVSSFVVTVASASTDGMKVEGVDCIFSEAHTFAVNAVVDWRDKSEEEVTGIRYEITPAARAD